MVSKTKSLTFLFLVPQLDETIDEIGKYTALMGFTFATIMRLETLDQ